ncbi:unnamed protein product [Ixodes persulcatus]
MSGCVEKEINTVHVVRPNKVSHIAQPVQFCSGKKKAVFVFSF